MNKTNDGGKYGFTQYTFPHNYDLKGSTFTLFSSDDTLNVEFCSKTELICNGAEYGYESMKIENDIYFVLFGHTVLVLDTADNNALLIKGSEYIYYAAEKGSNNWVSTDNMDGTYVKWFFGYNRFVNHIYGKDTCKVQWVGVGNPYEEYPATCIFLKKAIYLVDITAPIPEKIGLPENSERIIMIQDYDRVLFTGCIFGKDRTVAVSGYGKFPE